MVGIRNVHALPDAELLQLLVELRLQGNAALNQKRLLLFVVVLVGFHRDLVDLFPSLLLDESAHLLDLLLGLSGVHDDKRWGD